jgi:hypothetical protein
MAQHSGAYKHSIAAKYQLIKKMIERAKALRREAHPLKNPPSPDTAPVGPSLHDE